jgi:hypothetical protein
LAASLQLFVAAHEPVTGTIGALDELLDERGRQFSLALAVTS